MSLSAGHRLPSGAANCAAMPAAERVDRKAVVAATVGCMLEWYDFALYGYFSVLLSRLFFPAESEWVSLLLAVATFGVGFAMRPVGALVLGTVADRLGRRVALNWAISTMVLGTAIITFTPAYATIGLWAPALIVVARLIQGFSAGGEMGTAVAFLIEHAPRQRRMLYASFQQLTQLLALLLGSLVGAAVNGWMSPADLESWGWRLPFALGLVIGPVGWYIRRHTEEPREFAQVLARRREQGAEAAAFPWSAVRRYPRETLAGFCITILWTVGTYFFLVYMPTYAVRELHLPATVSLLSNSAALLTAAFFLPLFAIAADRWGPRPILLAAALAMMALCYPLMAWLAAAPGTMVLVAVQCIFAVILAAFTGPASGAIAALFPADVRSTGVSIAYNFAVTLFGGFASFIATWLIGVTGSSLAPVWYVGFAAAAAVAGAAIFPEHAGRGRQ